MSVLFGKGMWLSGTTHAEYAPGSISSTKIRTVVTITINKNKNQSLSSWHGREIAFSNVHFLCKGKTHALFLELVLLILSGLSSKEHQCSTGPFWCGIFWSP
jgi:hypothetical protein